MKPRTKPPEKHKTTKNPQLIQEMLSTVSSEQRQPLIPCTDKEPLPEEFYTILNDVNQVNAKKHFAEFELKEDIADRFIRSYSRFIEKSLVSSPDGDGFK